MYSVYDTLAGGLPHSDIHGSTPARGSPWLFAACHVLHRLLVPRHPPNALLILDIRDRCPKEDASPCTETILRRSCQGSVVSCQKTTADRRPIDCLRTVLEISTPHTTGFSRIAPPLAACASTARNSTKSFTTPLNPRRQPLGRYPHRQQFPVRQFGRTTHQFSGVSCQGSEPDRPAKPMHQHLLMHAPRDAPEPDSHFQRTISPNRATHKRHDHTTSGRFAQADDQTEFGTFRDTNR